MKVLITGVPNIVEESVVRLALEGMEGKTKFKILSFSDFMGSEDKAADELKVLKNTQKKIRDSIQMSMIKAKAGDHIIVNGYFTVKGKYGFLPVINKELLDIFKPDFVVHIDVHPLAVEAKIKNPKEFEYHQELERTCAILIGGYSGCAFKFIDAGIDGAREAANELYGLLKGMMVK
ncbi:MAG: AAA family ATPase [Candidatus Aenigmatarchaeota archaeon]|nr:MAG: AAA family ATPase [Candidatus Aenigmarchaeota archaeon]